MSPLEIFIAICIVESGLNPNVKPGDNGRSIGIAQIQSGVIVDINERFNLNMRHEDALDPASAFKIFYYYTKRYNAQTPESMARLWNGGPRKRGTDNYWNRVKETLNDRRGMVDGRKRYFDIVNKR